MHRKVPIGATVPTAVPVLFFKTCVAGTGAMALPRSAGPCQQEDNRKVGYCTVVCKSLDNREDIKTSLRGAVSRIGGILVHSGKTSFLV